MKDYLNNKSFPFWFTLNCLDCNIFAFPFGLANNTKGSSAHHLKTGQLTQDSLVTSR